MTFFLEILVLGLKNLLLHKLRSFLTALGIICGVAAVITMVAIGEGNKRKALADIENLGARNIIVRSIKPPESQSANSGGESRQLLLTYGLTREDQRRIEATVKPIVRMIPLKQVSSTVSQMRHKASAFVAGTTPDLLEVTSLGVARGRFLSSDDVDRVDNVAVLGAQIAERLFPLEDPVGGTIRVNSQAFRVVGVLRRVGMVGGTGSALVGRDLNFDVYIPLSSARSRFGDMNIESHSGSFEATKVEVSELYVEVPSTTVVRDVADQVSRILEQGHGKTGDVTTIVPLELLDQAERTQRMFNGLMIAIASISLLVGGIGIMNIMLASVTERTREIGIRRALGATRQHIISQFLIETTVLSGLGGIMGVFVGLSGAGAIAILHGYTPAIERPHVTLWSVVVSFVAATTVGIIFGLYPAIRAAQQDPIVALRHD